MGKRNCDFAVGEYYHVYNRGVDKRVIFTNNREREHFLDLLDLCNRPEAMEHYARAKCRGKASTLGDERLVSIHAYCILGNHYHLILCELTEGGISRFMQKLGTSWTMYFNAVHERSGSLFQGKFKAVHIDTEEQFARIMPYVAANYAVHNITETDVLSSLGDYFKEGPAMVDSMWVRDNFSRESKWRQYCMRLNQETYRTRKQQPEIKALVLE